MTVGRPEEQMLICAARRSLDSSGTEQLRLLLQEQLDWDYLLTIANHHCLIPLLYQHVSSVDPSAIPEPDMLRLQRDNEGNTKTSLFLTGELIKILAWLEAEGVRAIPFKGPTLAIRAYGDVGLRQFGDLDILVHKRDVSKVKELLIGRGLEPTPELTKAQQAAQLRFDCACNFDNRQGVVLDVHWNILEPYLGFQFDPNCLWDRLQNLTIAGRELMTLSLEDLLLVLCLHGFAHSWERLGWICDVAAVVDRHEDINWQLLQKHAVASGARRVLFLGLLLARDLLDAQLPPEVSRAIDGEPNVNRIGKEIQQRLFAREKPPAKLFHDIALRLGMRERAADKLKSLAHLLATPRSYDWRFASLRPSLTFFYYFVRPARFLHQHAAKLRRREASASSCDPAPVSSQRLP